MPDSGLDSTADINNAPTVPVAAVAKRLGVAPATLRTWDRRYGLGPSRHTSGRHRRYDEVDISRLELMRQALSRGASTAEAAQYALTQVPKPRRSDHRVAGAGEVPGAARALGEADQHLASDPWASRLHAAARAMDPASTRKVISAALAELGTLTTWQDVIAPVLAAIARQPVNDEDGGPVGYLLTEAVLTALIQATPILATPRNERPILLLGVPGEQHTLPLYVLTAGLAERGVQAQPFGACASATVLTESVRRMTPAVVVLWAKSVGAVEEMLAGLMAEPVNEICIWGPGWAQASPPAGVRRLGDLSDALTQLDDMLVGLHPP